jgi:hypothetical protein
VGIKDRLHKALVRNRRNGHVGLHEGRWEKLFMNARSYFE